MTFIRRIGAVALAAPLAMAFPVFGALPAHAASTSVISPADGTVITSGSEVTAKAHFDFAITMQLWVDAPGTGATFLKEKGFSGDISGTIPLRLNGRYKVYLKGKQTGQIYDTNTFTVKIPPTAPSGVSAQVSGKKVIVKWNLGLEDDLTGYALSGSGVGSKTGSVRSLCSGTSCSATLSLTRSSGSVSVGVRAQRSSGTGGSVYSGTSSATAMAGGGSGALPGVTAPTLPGGTAPPTGTTPLTPFNNQSPVTLPGVQPNGATPGYTYPAPEIATDAPKAQNIAATDRLQWGKSVGIALILLIVAAHLGTWTRHLKVSQSGASSLGMAARIARSGTGRKRVAKAREHIARAEAVAKTAPVRSATSKRKPAPKKAAARDGAPALAGDTRDDGPARSGDTAVIAPPKPNTKPGRRPATLGKRSGGVNVRLTKPDTDAPKPKAKPKKDRRRK